MTTTIKFPCCVEEAIQAKVLCRLEHKLECLFEGEVSMVIRETMTATASGH